MDHANINALNADISQNKNIIFLFREILHCIIGAELKWLTLQKRLIDIHMSRITREHVLGVFLTRSNTVQA